MKNLLEAIEYSIKQLLSASIENPKFEAQYILAQILNLPRLELYLHKNRELNTDEIRQLEFVIKQRKMHKPLQYIFGETEFMAHNFLINGTVLIPRLETELLVQKIIDDYKIDETATIKPDEKLPAVDVLDIGTGSGIIAISLSHRFPNWNIEGIDISEAALEVAKINNSTQQTKVNFYQSDLFEKVRTKYDIIVSNPPYITAAEFKKLPREILDYEPQEALIAPEEGLYFYRKILEDAPDYLKPNGSIYFEIGSKQAESIEKLALDNGFRLTDVDKDYNLYNRVLKLKLIVS